MAKLYKIVWEIDVEADTPLEAAKTAQEYMRDDKCDWFFYVQKHDSDEILGVDLQEEDEDAVLKVLNYQPIIKPK